MKKKILVLPGDGIGPEVINEAVKVLTWFSENSVHSFELIYGAIGGASIDHYGVPLTSDTLAAAKAADSVLLGAVGGPKWERHAEHLRPEQGLLAIRKELQLYANLRPVKFIAALASSSSLKLEYIENLDLIIVRELVSDVYFGQPRGIDRQNEYAFNTMRYQKDEIERIARIAFELAEKRHKKVCSVDKANVLETSQYWRETVQSIRDSEFPDISLTHMYVDNAAMQLVRNPKQFDVMLTANLFGDILSDEASMLIGSLGLLPSASLGKQHSLYEPIHGSAPDIAGKNMANPIGAILSVAMMLEHTFHLTAEARLITTAVNKVLDLGYRTSDIMSADLIQLSTSQMGDIIVDQMT